MIWIIIAIVVVLFIVMYLINTYNGLIKFKNMVEDQWSQIDVQLKRRFDLIPNLVETVKGYATHEKETLDAVISARNTYASAATPKDSMKAEGELEGALSRLFALTEAYPDLKANVNFMKMQEELTETEDKIASSRQFYNDVVLQFNNKVEMFPSNIIAGMFNFKKEEYFTIDEVSKENVKVKF